jgi:hypothetical protein
MAAENHAQVSGYALVALATSLGGAILGPVILTVLCAIGGAVVAIGMRGPIAASQGWWHLLAGIVNAIAFVGILSWALAANAGLSDTDWLVPCGVVLGAVGNQYLAALGLIVVAWKKFRGQA